MDLFTRLYQQIQTQQGIPFVDFMQQVLYSPGLGYYSSGLQKFGAQGDFITAPELTPLFGQTLANQCQQILCHLEQPVLFEFGAGSGRLCIDLLTCLEEKKCLPKTYFILEVSSSLRHRQHDLIKKHIPHLLPRIEWLDHWPKTPFTGVVLANEVLDAMPVHRFLQTESGIFESYIILADNGAFAEQFRPCENSRLLEHVQHALPKEWHPYLSEANLFINDWLKGCYQMLEKGMLLLLDYGFPKQEYYHPDRNEGTLMCHYKHQAHSNFLIHLGEQDITAHVDFTQVADASHAAGFHVAGYTHLASFLLANGLLSLLENSPLNTVKRLNAQQAVKQLLQPHEMGELFKVMALTKEIDFPVQGFQLLDKRTSLE